MKDFGAEGSDDGWKTVTDYLVVHLAHLEVNKATAGEIAQVFGVNETIAAGVVAYRDQQGGFKTIDDLKKAPNLDGAKVDALKARLIFQLRSSQEIDDANGGIASPKDTIQSHQLAVAAWAKAAR